MTPAIRFIKRGADIVLSSIGILILLPLFPFIALAIRLDSPGPTFFIQERVGIDRRVGFDRRRGTRSDDEVKDRRNGNICGKTFRMVKLRTMRQDAEARCGPVWAEDDDPRITRIGKILRRFRIDECPQLFNVLKGNMSIVGPRPERAFFTTRLSDEILCYEERTAWVKPGITGLAQVNNGYDSSVESVKKKLLYDHAYGASLTRFRSAVWADISILLRTFYVVLIGRGAK